MTDLAKLVVRLEAETARYQKELEQARGRLKRFDRDASDTLKRIAQASTAAAAAAAAGSAAIVRSSVQAGKEIQNLAQISNAGVEEFQKYAFGARTVGIEKDKLADILKDVNDRVGDFISSGGGEMADFFENIAPKVGVTAEQFQKLSGPQALQLYYDSLQQANLSAQEQTFYLEAMASDTTALIPLLREGGKGFQEQAERAERLGVVLSKLDIASLSALENKIAETTATVRLMATTITAQVAPALDVLIDDFLDAREKSDELGSSTEKTAGTIVNGMAFAMNAIAGVKRVADIAGAGVATALALIENGAWSLADTIVNGPVKALNSMIQSAEDLTGIELPKFSMDSEFGKAIAEGFERTKRISEEGIADIERLLLKPLPGDQFLREYEKRLEELKERANKLSQGNGGGSGSGTTTPEEPSSDAGIPVVEGPDPEAERQRELNRIYRENIEIITGVDRATLDYQATLSDLNELFARGMLSQEGYNAAVERAEDAFNDTASAGEEWASRMDEITRSAARNIQSSFADFLFDPFEQGLSGMLDSFTETLRRMAAQAAAEQILKGVIGGGGLEGILGGIFGGARADGGPVSSGKAYVVGERGPEMFVPGTSGYIVNNETMNSRSVTQNITINAPNGRVDRATELQVQAAAGRGVAHAMRRNG